jgi:hypothetical protein
MLLEINNLFFSHKEKPLFQNLNLQFEENKSLLWQEKADAENLRFSA